MMDWNPITHDFCRACPLYEPAGQFIYELERAPSKRVCKYLAHCNRVAGLYTNEQIKGQLKFDNI